ncbi:MAG: tRNA threonylcarbamoyladenosine dehydratase [Oscillospiraceae bacterium]|nr:tRNA threonylcarbamoyladenosine dehydratase [Oscillospiraceae bacterium]
MAEQFSRTELIFGREAMEKLARSRVAVFGVGGVGGYAVEALARSGVGALDLIDPDRVSLSNLNRQLHALHSTLGRLKVEAAAERVRDINPACAIRTRPVFFLPETRSQFDFAQYDYVVDAIDTVTGKLALIEAAREAGVPIICAMGAGNKTDPSAFRAADLYETSVCPLARVLRKECRRRGIEHVKVVCSEEKPLRPLAESAETPPEGRRALPGSTAFVPAAAGLVLAGEVVRDLIGFDRAAREEKE